MILRNYCASDAAQLALLFYETVHAVNARDYTPEQLRAWAAGEVDLAAWNASFQAHHTVVAEEQGCNLAFGDMDESGYLDRLYVHKAHQRRGIATAICDCLERGTAVPVLHTDASITARPFFEGRGYRVVRRQEIERRGVLLVNYHMEKMR